MYINIYLYILVSYVHLLVLRDCNQLQCTERVIRMSESLYISIVKNGVTCDSV